MHPDTHEKIVSKLRSLIATKPERAIDELEVLMDGLSASDLAAIMKDVYHDVSEELGIDWQFTTLQWKLGNRGNDSLHDGGPPVWSLPLQKEEAQASETRYITCFPFRFEPAWEAHGTRVFNR